MIRMFTTSVCVLFLGLTFSLSKSYAQCTGCIPNVTLCQGTSGPCPAAFDTAYAFNSYNDTLTFNLPATVDASQQSGGLLGIVPFVEFKVANIQGLPFGINWTCSVPNCTYQPYANNGTMACVRFCGVAFTPGVYNVTINAVGTIDGGNLGFQSGAENFTLVFVVLPDTNSGNAGFSFGSNSYCAPSTVNFINNIPSNGYVPGPLNSGFTYTWDFGNGLQSTVENPPPVIYNTPGSYPVTYTARIDTLPIALKEVNLTGANCTDFLNPADYYIKIFDASNVEVFNNETSQSTSLPFLIPVNIAITNPPYRIEVWDDDTAPLFGTADDNCYDGTENPHPLVPLQLPPGNTFGLTTYQFVAQGTSLAFTYTYEKQVIEFTAEDTVVIYANPPMPVMNVSPADQVCNRDSIELSVYPNFSYEWIMNDTVSVYTGLNHFYYAKLPGSYKVIITDPASGCSTVSGDTTVSFFPNTPPGFPNVGISINQNGDLASALIGNNYTYQWLFFDGTNFIPIPAPEGIAPTLTPVINGSYALICLNEFGCGDTSNVINFMSVGTETFMPQASVEIFPNPTNGKTWIKMENAGQGDVQVKLMNMVGEFVMLHQLPAAGNAFQSEIDLGALANGVYIVEIQAPSGTFTRRIIKK